MTQWSRGRSQHAGVRLTGSALFECVRQPLLQPADLLLAAPQLCLLLAAPLLQAGNLEQKVDNKKQKVDSKTK